MTDPVYDWSMAWTTEFWEVVPSSYPGLLMLKDSLGDPLSSYDFTAARIERIPLRETVSAQRDTAEWTFTDPSECLDVEISAIGHYFDPNLTRVTIIDQGIESDRVWSLVQHTNHTNIEYLECRIMVPGESYLLMNMMVDDFDPVAKFNTLAPELEAMLKSITFRTLIS